MSGVDIAEYDIALPDRWHAMPLETDAAAWPDELAAQLVLDEEARGRLAAGLRVARDGVLDFADWRMRAAAFVEFPETGAVSGILVMALVETSALGSPDALAASLAEPQTADGASPYGAQVWRSQVDAGALVGAHYLLAHPAAVAAGAPLEERVVVTVFPSGAAQAVQIVASANGIGAFPDMASSIEEIVATLRVHSAEAEPEGTR